VDNHHPGAGSDVGIRGTGGGIRFVERNLWEAMEAGLSATQLIYKARFGEMPEAAEGKCYLCGGVAYSPSLLKDVIKPTFTDFDIARGNMEAGVCCGCVFTMDESSEWLRELRGKEKPQRTRNYSLFVLNGKLHVFSKAEKDEMCDILLGGIMPEVAIIGTSGQKHLAFKALANSAGQRAGWLQFEEQRAWLELDEFAGVHEQIQVLYDLRCSKAAISTGNYNLSYLKSTEEIAAWIDAENAVKPYRGSVVFELSVYLVTKGETEDE
jgi:hypothetical protein